MDPVPFTPPEVILNYGEEQSGSLPLYHFPPRYHRPFPAELNTSGNETSSREARTDGSASQKPATVAEMLRSTAANSDHRTSQTQTASNQTPMGPVQHQGSPSFLHFLPGVSPSPLSLQDFSPDPPQMGLSPLLPELVFTSCSPQDPLWLNMNPLSVTPDSRFGVSPCVLVPVSTPTEPWFSPDSPARFRLPQPQFCPSWCVCPESVPVHQPCTPGLLPSRAESAASGREQSAEQCKSGEKEHREETSAEEKLQADDSVNNTTKSETSLTFLEPLDEEFLANRAFEDYMSIMDALSPEVGLILDTEYLDSLLSSSLAPIDLLALEEQEQVASTLNIEEHTDSFLSSDHSEAIDFIPLKEQEEEVNLSFVEDSRDPQAGGDISGSVPEKQTVEPPERLQVPQESATPGVFSELRTGKRRETKTKCERDPEKGGRASVTRKPNKEKGMIKKTFEKKEEKKETKLIRRSQRQSGQRLFVEYKTETAEEKKPSEKSIKKTAQSTPEKDEVIYEKQRRYSGEKQLCKKEESQGTNVINSEQSGETADEKQGQKLAGDQREANSSDVCAETGEQNALSTKTQQNKMSKERVNREEEAVRMPCIVRRRTRSMVTEEKVQLSPVLSPSTRARQKNKHSEMQRSETKSSPKRGKQVEPEGNEQENVSEPQTLPVSSPKKRSRGRRDEEEKSETVDETQSSGCKAEEEASPSLLSPRVQTQSAQDSKDDQGSLEESPEETLLNEINEPLSAKTCEQQMKTVNDGDKSHDFYSLRSTTRNTRQVRKSEKPEMLDIRGTQDDEATQAAHRSSGLRDTSPDKTADVNGEREKTSEEEHPGVTLSPVKRHGDKVELESETHRLSLIKRARRKKTEVSERDEEQTGNETRDDEAENQDEADTSGCISSPASAGGDIKEEFAKNDAGWRPSKDEHSVAETRGDRFPCRRRTRLLVKLPTKYEDFILCKTKRTRQTAAGQAEKKDGKRKKR
eukprot:superscaffoldBa00000616_g6083